jgi:hypothetical protein
MDGLHNGVRLAGKKRIEVCVDFAFLRLPSPSLTFRTLVQFFQMPANAINGWFWISNHTFPPYALLNSANCVNGTRHRLAGPSHRFQCELVVLRTLVTPLSGSMHSSSLKSTVLPFASSFPALTFGPRALRRRHSPSHHGQRALAVAHVNDGSRVVGIDSG